MPHDNPPKGRFQLDRDTTNQDALAAEIAKVHETHKDTWFWRFGHAIAHALDARAILLSAEDVAELRNIWKYEAQTSSNPKQRPLWSPGTPVWLRPSSPEHVVVSDEGFEVTAVCWVGDDAKRTTLPFKCWTDEAPVVADPIGPETR